jgi:GNAT superfamily N-acetyltransferase
MQFRLATLKDIPLIAQWREDAARWLAAKDTDQWSDAGITREEFTSRVRQSVQEHGTWIVELDDAPVATFAADNHEDDAGLWEPQLLSESVVLHRMIVARDAAGLGIGAAILGHAERIAQERGKKWLILDAWTTNRGLHDYYRSQGFSYIGTVENHSTESGALFVRSVP